jgi:hypothetical protein
LHDVFGGVVRARGSNVSDLDAYRDCVVDLVSLHYNKHGFGVGCSQYEEIAGAAAVAICMEVIGALEKRVEELESQMRFR